MKKLIWSVISLFAPVSPALHGTASHVPSSAQATTIHSAIRTTTILNNP